MLTIARGATITKQVSNLNTIVKGYLASLEHQKLEKVFPSLTFRTDLDPGLLNISCSTIHIEKALMNLVTNASEAIEQLSFSSGTYVVILTHKHVYDFEVLEKVKGSELEGVEYEQLFHYVKATKKAFYVCAAEFVSTEDGSGIVHIAPAFGADDYDLSKKYD